MEDKKSDLLDRNYEITESEETKEERMNKSKESLHDLWSSVKHSCRITGVPE